MARLLKKLLPFVLLFIISILYTHPFITARFFKTHDGEWAIVRLAEMQREVIDRQIPPRWAGYLNHGYGYPLFQFTYPFPYYVGLFIRFVGFGLVDSVKVVFVLSVIISGLAMYLLGRELNGTYAGFIAAVFYISAPYRLVNLYARGSIGESLALAVIPILFYSTLRFVVKPTSTRLAIGSLCLAILILTHNVTALVTLPIFIVYYFALVKAYFEDLKTYTLRLLLLCILGFGIAAYFFIPALFEKDFIALSLKPLADVNEHFVQLREFVVSPWSYGNRPTFSLGLFHLLGAALSICTLIIAGQVQWKKNFPIILYLLGSMILIVFFTNKASLEFWLRPPLSWIDFPWRLLTPLTFLLSLSTIFLGIHKRLRILGVVFCIAALILSLQFVKPEEVTDKQDSYYSTNDATTTSADELMPIWVIDKPRNRFAQKVEVRQGDAIISDITYSSQAIQFSTQATVPSQLQVNTLYFPGWEFRVDGNKVNIDYSNPTGTIYIDVVSGRHEVSGFYARTPIRMVADSITVASLLILIFMLVKSFLLNIQSARKNHEI